MTNTEALQHLSTITKRYFEGATVDFAKRTRKVKPQAPFVVITPGSPARDLFPTTRLVADRVVSYYQTRLPVQIDLYTNGGAGEPEEDGYVPSMNTAVEDMTDFLDFLESPYVTNWCFRLNVSIVTTGVVQDLTALITDSDFEFRAMTELTFCFVHKAVGHSGVEGESSIKHPSEPEAEPGEPVDPEAKPGEPIGPDTPGVTPSKVGDGSEPGYFVPDDSKDDVTVEPVYEPSPSGGRSKELVEETQTGYFTNVEINDKPVKKEEDE